MGAEVYALTHSEKKAADIKEMGASHMILTNEKDFEKKHFRELDLILSTVDKVEGLPLDKLSKLLKVGGALRTVGLPDANAPVGPLPDRLRDD
jgi:alcohol dehydrogenase (NADP+)